MAQLDTAVRQLYCGRLRHVRGEVERQLDGGATPMNTNPPACSPPGSVGEPARYRAVWDEAKRTWTNVPIDAPASATGKIRFVWDEER